MRNCIIVKKMLFLLNSFHIGPQDKLDLAFEARRPEKKKAFLSVLFLQPQQDKSKTIEYYIHSAF